MIIVFHTLYFIVRYLRKIYKESQVAKTHKPKCHPKASEVMFQNSITSDDAFGVRFDPPLYKQRYATVQQILLNEKYRPKIRKIVDYGCSELHFFVYMKHLFGISEIICVDIDEDVLREHRFNIRPLNVDFLKKRSQKLTVKLLCGSVSDPDYRVKGADAVIGIELIEHLYPDTLEALPFNIFGFIRPLLVVLTTPNAEFNVVFGRNDGFRHFDHKFEWNRDQFEDWCRNITKRFPTYQVYFDGLGNPPNNHKKVGFCTQYAVFLKDCLNSISVDEITPPAEPLGVNKESFGICTYYSYTKQLGIYETDQVSQQNRVFGNDCPVQMGNFYKEIEVIEYPYEIDSRSPEKRILDEVLYKIYSVATPYSRFYNENTDRIEMPLYMLISNDEGCFTTGSEVRTLLEKEKFRIEECCLESGRDEKTLCVVYELDATMNNRNSRPDDADSNDEQPLKIPWSTSALEESDWDSEYLNASGGVKINDEKVEEEKLQDAPQQLHNQINSEKDVNNKITHQYHTVIPEKTTSNNEKKPKKGTNIKNRQQPSTSNSQKNNQQSNKANNESFKIAKSDSVKSTSEESSSNNKKSNKSGLKTSTKMKLFAGKTSKINDNNLSSIPSTSDSKKKRKKSNPDETKDEKKDDVSKEDINRDDVNKEDIKNMFECFVYNTLNKIEIPEECTADETIPSSNDHSTCEDIKELMELDLENQIEMDGLAKELIEDVLVNINVEGNVAKNNNEQQMSTSSTENGNQELNMASREALFDPNSETDMLEEFGIPPEIAVQDNQINLNNQDNHINQDNQLNQNNQIQPNIIVIGVNINDEDGVVMAENTEQFPNWLLQLLGANVEDPGESHDEPHFYCQGDGIDQGVHPSIIEVELDEEESSSDSTSSNDQAEAERTISESVVGPLPNDELETSEPIETASGPNLVTAGSATESTDEFFDTIDEQSAFNVDTSRMDPDG
ncbi:dentin sialophosphoprotein isoform X1 [Onthophagus taurus]|uniref:dentin sialophosphoprotein isoform X1 n=1 Tax=Onthophagus taurus TaxID=166361 RepID=UPI0039BEB572